MAVQLSPARGARPLDVTVNVVPFIDLLSCCIAFLLITAVWSQVAGLGASSAGAAEGSGAAPPTLAVAAAGYELTLPDGGRLAIAPGELAAVLRARRGELTDLVVRVADGVDYDRLVRALDAARGAGFVALAVEAQ
jgi:biopolymer transport protein ExbD